jgi:hypothetical protein
MNVKRLFVSLLLPLVLAACATGPKLSEMVIVHTPLRKAASLMICMA